MRHQVGKLKPDEKNKLKKPGKNKGATVIDNENNEEVSNLELHESSFKLKTKMANNKNTSRR